MPLLGDIFNRISAQLNKLLACFFPGTVRQHQGASLAPALGT